MRAVVVKEMRCILECGLRWYQLRIPKDARDEGIHTVNARSMFLWSRSDLILDSWARVS